MNPEWHPADDPTEVESTPAPVRAADTTPDAPTPDEPVPEVPARLADSPVSLPEPQPEPQPVPTNLTLPGRDLGDLEQRVRRLEEILAQMQQGRAPTQQHVTEAAPSATPLSAEPPSPTSTPPSRPAPTAPPRTTSWLFWEMFIELRAVVRMYTDPRYQMSWFGRTIPLLLLLVFVFSSFAIPLAGVPVVGWLFQKVGELIVVYALVKSLSYEARRYRQKAPDLPASLRL